MSVKILEVNQDNNGRRLDNYLISIFKNIPKSKIYNIIRKGEVRINSGRVKPHKKIKTGDQIRIPPYLDNIDKIVVAINPKLHTLIKDNIVFENNNFLIINKPYGISVHAGSKNNFGIIDIARDIYGSSIDLCHRIDKETSGILIIAKNRKYAQLFTSLFRIRKIHKTYLALAYGKINKTVKSMRDDLTYFENKKKIIQKAISNIKIIKSNDELSYIELNPITGRKHQLRKQLLNLGNPIIGDDKYFLTNFKKIKTKNLMLHAYKIKFMINNVQYNFKAKYNNFFEQI